MSKLRDVFCVAEHRDKLCRGIVQSLRAIGLDEDVFAGLARHATEGTPSQKNYLILTAIVRLAGLYEAIAIETPFRHMAVLNDLYVDMNRHLMGVGGPSNAPAFARRWTARIEWMSRDLPEQASLCDSQTS